MQVRFNGTVPLRELRYEYSERLENAMQALGRHWIVEFWGCNDAVNCADTVRSAITEAVEIIGATLLHLHVQRFEPHGVTGLAVLAESHFSVHSWPEHDYLAVDIFTCGATAQPEKAVGVLRRHFQPTSVEVAELKRGVPPEIGTGMQLERRPHAENGTHSHAEPKSRTESR